MKKVLVLFAILISNLAFADFPGLSKIEGASLYCSNKGGMYAFNFKDKRVWQADAGDKEGLELADVIIKIYRCPNCFDVSGDLAGIKINLQIRQNGATKPVANGTFSGETEDGIETEKIGPLNCSTKNN